MDSVTQSQQEQNQDPETEEAEWDSAIFNFIGYTCSFLTVRMSSSYYGGKLTAADNNKV